MQAINSHAIDAKNNEGRSWGFSTSTTQEMKAFMEWKGSLTVYPAIVKE
jgi:hypothetical protein